MTQTSKITEQVETMRPSPTSEKNQQVKENKEQILLTQKQLAKIKEDLNKIIDAMALNPSFFSRAAQFWGELPLWQKIIAGIILIVPVFIISIAAHTITLLAISIFTLITYTASSILLDNHHSQNVCNTEHLKTSISSLANALGTVIMSLDTLREQLALEINKFQKENAQLTANISLLREEINTLISRSAQLMDTEQKLREIQGVLEKTILTFKNSAQEQSELLIKNKIELEKVTQDYEKNQTQLTKKTLELNQVKVEMGLAIEKAKTVVITLQGAVHALSNTLITDGKQRVSFQQRLNEFLTNNEESFDKVAERICDAERKLLLVKEELQLSNDRYTELLQRAEKQIERLEQIDNVQATQTPPPPISPAVVLKTLGLYAFDEAVTSSVAQKFASNLDATLEI